MTRLSRFFTTVALLVVVSLPAILVVVASCVGAAHIQQILLTTSFPRRRQR